jgi:hypothetical protein
MRFLSLRNILVSCVLVGAPAGAMAQPAPYDDVDQYDGSIGGEPIASVDVFYDQLSPHGVWLDDPDFGYVFTPESPSFVPYTEGHWQYTNVGFVWVSSAPFDWATAHYGRWAFSRGYNRWVWLPDTTWGPAWVEWRESGDRYGWAPMAPQIAITIGYTPPVTAWRYAPANRLFDVNLVRYYEPQVRVVEYHRRARPVERYHAVGGVRVVVGPSAARLREHRVEVRRTKVEGRIVGRWSATETRVATQRAQERRQVNETRNRQRIEANATLRAKVAAVRAQPRREAPKADPRPTPAPRAERPEPRPTPRAERPNPRVDRPAPNPRPTPAPRAETPNRPTPAPRAERPDRPTPAPRAERPDRPTPAPRAERPDPRPNPAPRAERPDPRPNPAPRAERPDPRPNPAPRAERPDPRPRAETPNPRAERPAPKAEPRPAPAPRADRPERPAPKAEKPAAKQPERSADRRDKRDR